MGSNRAKVDFAFLPGIGPVPGVATGYDSRAHFADAFARVWLPVMSSLPGLSLSEDIPTLAATYARDGVVPVPGLLSGGTLDALIEQVAAFRADGESSTDPRASVKHLPGRSIVRGLAHRPGVMRDLATDNSIAAFLAAVAGVATIRYWNDLTLAYAPAAPAGESGWHHDIPAFPLRAEAMPTLWIALSNVGWDSSPLVFMSGSHRSGDLYRPSTATDAPMPDGYSALPSRPVPSADDELPTGDSDLKWWPMHPGDAVVMHSHVIHCTPANRNEEHERVSILTRWVSEDAVWHRDPFSTPIPGVPEAEWQPGAPAPDSFLT